MLQLLSLLALIVGVSSAAVAGNAQAQRPLNYHRRELEIPVRDGITLHAVALLPTDTTRPFPIILIRTPFGAEGEFRSSELPPQYRELGEDGYIFVTEDIRGRFGSGGEFVSLRRQRDPHDPRGIDESTDAFDTIDWLVKNVPHNNGRVGAIGISYRGWLAALAGVNPHPALKAISPQAPVTDTWLGDDFFHQGAFRQSQGMEYSALMERDPHGFSPVPIAEYDHYDFYLKFPTLDSLARASEVARLPSWLGFSTHPSYDSYWQSKALQNVLTRASVPTLLVGGWWDQEDILGPQLMYRTLEAADSGQKNRVVLGPWFHGGWAQPAGDSLGPVALGSNTAEYFRQQIQRPWLAYYLHGQGDGRFPEAWAFETGENQWHQLDSWPPHDARQVNLYLRDQGRITFDPPPAGAHDSTAYASYLSDPAHPVPYVRRPDDGNGWRTWLVQDQRFVENRPDVATWRSEPLKQDLIIAGDVAAHLFASTSGSDADWVAKLIDVYPDSVSQDPGMGGYQLMVNGDIMRGRYWRSFSRPQAIPQNRVIPFTIDLHQQLYRFRKGHRIMVQVQSTWFPLYDRNPQTFVPNIFHARAADFRSREHRIWHTARYPSRVSVSVLNGQR
jgi:uncharacterized protein